MPPPPLNFEVPNYCSLEEPTRDTQNDGADDHGDVATMYEYEPEQTTTFMLLVD